MSNINSMVVSIYITANNTCPALQTQNIYCMCKEEAHVCLCSFLHRQFSEKAYSQIIILTSYLLSNVDHIVLGTMTLLQFKLYLSLIKFRQLSSKRLRILRRDIFINYTEYYHYACSFSLYVCHCGRNQNWSESESELQVQQ